MVLTTYISMNNAVHTIYIADRIQLWNTACISSKHNKSYLGKILINCIRGGGDFESYLGFALPIGIFLKVFIETYLLIFHE